ncbi:MAG TPA: MBL fold metallo-hydrolase [Bacteroidales bacterium]|nr:MBL fold metallo-hydrolase [Bacteroidales bacterium]
MKNTFYIMCICVCTTLLAQCQSIPTTNIMEDEVYIKCFPTGIYNSNCYVVSKDGLGFMVDAGAPDTTVLQYIRENNIKIKYIFCTHSHIDHVLFAPEAKQYTGGKIVLHANDEDHYKYYTSERIGEWMKSGQVTEQQMPYIEKFIHIKYDTLVHGDEEFAIGKLKVKILYTPGHSKGSMCIFLNEKYLFTGDAVFNDNVGNAEISSGNISDLEKYIKEEILVLSDDVVLFQGHGGKMLLKDLLPKISF